MLICVLPACGGVWIFADVAVGQRGSFVYRNAAEDSATAEISRSQVRDGGRYKAKLDSRPSNLALPLQHVISLTLSCLTLPSPYSGTHDLIPPVPCSRTHDLIPPVPDLLTLIGPYPTGACVTMARADLAVGPARA